MINFYIIKTEKFNIYEINIIYKALIMKISIEMMFFRVANFSYQATSSKFQWCVLN